MLVAELRGRAGPNSLSLAAEVLGPHPRSRARRSGIGPAGPACGRSATTESATSALPTDANVSSDATRVAVRSRSRMLPDADDRRPSATTWGRTVATSLWHFAGLTVDECCSRGHRAVSAKPLRVVWPPAGARLLITARRQDRLERLSRELRELSGGIYYCAGDITDPPTRHQLIQIARAALGRLGYSDQQRRTWGPWGRSPRRTKIACGTSWKSISSPPPS